MLFIINKYYYIIEVMKKLKYLSKKILSPKIKYLLTQKLYFFTPKTSLSLLILSSLFLYIFLDQVSNKTLLISWFILINILNITRVFDYLQYKRAKQSHYDTNESDKWYNRFRLKAILHAMFWAALPLLSFHDLSYNYQLFMILFLIGLAGGVAGFLADIRIAFPFISILLLPLSVIILFSTIPNALILSLLITVFYILLIISNLHTNQLYYDKITTKELFEKAKKSLTEKEKKLNSLLEQAPIGIFYYDTELKIIRYNQLFYNIFGLDKDLLGFNLNELKDKKAVDMMREVLKSDHVQKSVGSYDFSFKEQNIWVELTCSALRDEQNNITGGIGIIEDKTIEHQAYEKINFISLHDSLTKLPNRRFYKKFMINLIQNPKNQDHYSILLYMDLNHFKQINDTFGHTIGDNLLLEVSQRFKSLKIEKSNLARLGGDEFVLTLPFVSKDAQKAKERAKEIANRIKGLFIPVFEINNLNLYMTTSIGIVIIEPKTDDIDNILRQADMAMYQTKREGRDNINFYNKRLDLEQQELTSLQQDLNHALTDNELVLHYQPIVNIHDDSLVAIEALIRWQHPTKGLIMPDRFIPMATESGLINKLGWWVANEVCRQLSLWKQKDKLNFEYVAININARQLHEVNFSEHIESCILKYRVNPSLIKLEVTETTLIDSFSKTQKIIKDLRERGVECSIDDFGTGYSSLSYLKKLSFKVLKIDRIFITDILTNQDDQELVKSIIAIGQQFNYKIIIEGIETEEQKKKIFEINQNVCYQGYLCSRPIPASTLEERFLSTTLS
jgi:diguanylate cyclase (GGDEF)-like protein/PAS domain S-box-containing protein